MKLIISISAMKMNMITKKDAITKSDLEDFWCIFKYYASVAMWGYSCYTYFIEGIDVWYANPLFMGIYVISWSYLTGGDFCTATMLWPLFAGIMYFAVNPVYCVSQVNSFIFPEPKYVYTSTPASPPSTPQEETEECDMYPSKIGYVRVCI